MHVPFSVFCVLFVCICVLYNYHLVSTQLQLKNISYIYIISYQLYILTPSTSLTKIENEMGGACSIDGGGERRV